MLTLEFCKEGKPYSDFTVIEDVKKQFEKSVTEDVHLQFSTENALLAARLLLFRGEIKPDQIRFQLEDGYHQFDAKGKPAPPVETFFDTVLDELLGL